VTAPAIPSVAGFSQGHGGEGVFFREIALKILLLLLAVVSSKVPRWPSARWGRSNPDLSKVLPVISTDVCAVRGLGLFLTPVAVRVSTRATQGPVALSEGLGPRGQPASRAARLLGTESFWPCLTASPSARHAKAWSARTQDGEREQGVCEPTVLWSPASVLFSDPSWDFGWFFSLFPAPAPVERLSQHWFLSLPWSVFSVFFVIFN